MAPTRACQAFRQIVALSNLQAPVGSYERLWVPLITLWYLIWQWLQPRHTLEALVTDARRDGADGLCARAKPLSRGIKSRATTAYSDARQRLPLDWVCQRFTQFAAALLTLGEGRNPDLPVELLDGSAKRLRPYGDVAQHFPAHRTRRQQAYWCVARVLVSFCAATGIATAARIASNHVSEQALAVELILAAARRVLYIGDRNFGVWRVVRAATQVPAILHHLSSIFFPALTPGVRNPKPLLPAKSNRIKPDQTESNRIKLNQTKSATFFCIT